MCYIVQYARDSTVEGWGGPAPPRGKPVRIKTHQNERREIKLATMVYLYLAPVITVL